MTTTQIGATTHVTGMIITSITTMAGDTSIRTIISLLHDLIVSATGSTPTATT